MVDGSSHHIPFMHGSIEVLGVVLEIGMEVSLRLYGPSSLLVLLSHHWN
jgi:hypothetical protein